YTHIMFSLSLFITSFFFHVTATSDIYTLSLHDALPIFSIDQNAELGQFVDRLVDFADPLLQVFVVGGGDAQELEPARLEVEHGLDRKSTRLNSSHVEISYAVFCLKKKKKKK